MIEPVVEISGNSLEKMLGLLDLYTADRPAWTAEQMAGQAKCSVATIYRYVKALTNSGLLAPASSGTFVLGARIIQLDRQIRLSDPLIAASRSWMTKLSKKFGENLILCSFYGSHVICIHEEWPDSSYTTSYVRGNPMPLFKGAVSKVILANLPVYKLKSLMLYQAREIAAAGLGSDWVSFKSRLKEIRKDGYCVAAGEVDPGLTGTAVPLFGAERQITGALCLIQPLKRFSKETLPKRIEALKSASEAVSEEMSAQPRAERKKFQAPAAPSGTTGSRRLA